MSTPEDESGNTDPVDPGVPEEDLPEDPFGPLAAPYGLTVANAVTGGWSVKLNWEYSHRFRELDSFQVQRQKYGEPDWEVVETGIENNVRTITDMLPDEGQYTYTVTAIPLDGGEPLVSDPPLDSNGNPIYISADEPSTRPQNIRKPLRSTRQKMFVAWNYHPAASSYTMEAIGLDDEPYYSVHITDVFAPYGLFVGEHDEDMVTVRVSIMRRRDDGTEYVASSAEEEFFVDDIRDPHFGVVDIEGQDSTTLLNRNLGFSVVLGLAEFGTDTAQLTVGGVMYDSVWIDHNGHKSATVECCYPAGSAPSVAMRIAAPDNLQSEGGS